MHAPQGTGEKKKGEIPLLSVPCRAKGGESYRRKQREGEGGKKHLCSTQFHPSFSKRGGGGGEKKRGAPISPLSEDQSGSEKKGRGQERKRKGEREERNIGPAMSIH